VAAATDRAPAVDPKRELSPEIRDALMHVTEAILEGEDAESVLLLIVQHARALVGADGAVGIGLDVPGGTIVSRVAEGLGADTFRSMQGTVSGSISGDVMQTGRPFAIPDVSVDPRVPAEAKFPDFGPALFVPLVVRGGAIGIIDLVRVRGGQPFSEEHTKLAQLFAAQAAVAMDYARNADARRRALDRLQAMADVTNAILEGATVDSALQRIARAARRLVAATNAGVLIEESPGGALVIRAFDATAKYQVLQGLRVTGDSVAARVIRSGRTIVMEDAASDARTTKFRELVPDVGPAVCVPLKAGGRRVGAISLTRARSAAAFTEEDVSVAEAFASQAAVVLEYGRNLAERQKAERRVAAGMEVTQAIIEGRDTTDVLQLIAARARDLVGAAFAAIVSPEADGNHLIARVTDGANAEAYRGARLPVANSLTCLLYTSPSPRDLSTSRMPSSA